MQQKYVLLIKLFVSTCIYKTLCEVYLILFNRITGYKNHIKTIRFILLSYQLSVARPKEQSREISRRTIYFTDRLITVDERNDRFRLLPIAHGRSKKHVVLAATLYTQTNRDYATTYKHECTTYSERSKQSSN